MTEIFILAFSVFFIYGILQEGMIGHKIGDYLEKELPDNVYTALFGCPPCMTIWYGLPMCFIFNLQGNPAAIILSAAGFNFLILAIYIYIVDDVD